MISLLQRIDIFEEIYSKQSFQHGNKLVWLLFSSVTSDGVIKTIIYSCKSFLFINLGQTEILKSCFQERLDELPQELLNS